VPGAIVPARRLPRNSALYGGEERSRAAKPVEKSDARAIAPELRNDFQRFMQEQEKGTPLAPALTQNGKHTMLPA
jgi:hypothetical protein